MTFYAEHQTDRYIRETFFPDTQFGVMVEVGAAGPTFLSMSRHFREGGWKVLAVEPNPYFVEQHKKEGFDVIQCACGELDADQVDFEIVHQPADYDGGRVSYESFSSLRVIDSYRKLNPSISTQTIKVNVRRLDRILAENKIDRVDFLSIDVEGWELEVMRGCSGNPSVVVMENLMQDTAYPRYMRNRGYRLAAKMPPNEIYTFSGSFLDRVLGKLF